MSIINTLPLTLTNGTTADATQVMSLLAWIQSQTNGNACPATVGTSILKGDGAGGTTAAVAGTDYPPVASPTFTGSVTAPTFVGALTGDVTGNLVGATVAASGLITAAAGTSGNQVINFSQFVIGNLINVGEWVEFPNGLIIQIGVGISSGATINNVNVTFPTPYTSSCWGAIGALGQVNQTGVVHEIWTGAVSKTNALFTTLNSGNYSTGIPIVWLAIGQ